MAIKTRKNITFKVNDNPTYESFWNDENWEQFTYNCVEKFSKPNGIFIDIGAWIGPISIYAAALNNKCYAVEPDEVAYNELTTNLKLNNGIKNVICSQIAIFNKDGEICLGSESFGNSNTRVNSECILNPKTLPKDFVTVKCQTLTSFIKNNNINLEEISMIKIDVEGAEVEIIEDSFFKNNLQIPVHLSLHPALFKSKTYNSI